ncbi:MAG: NADP-dependent malic enzyme [Deltaproteobacteria bacterium]|nr:NADP-dependent malic enzyme [Deltaproteobacteria bacterium]
MSTLQDDARRYHAEGRPGKIEVSLTKPCATQRDLSLAYTPGVATPCLDIEKDPEKAYEYTAKGNLVAVISNGTAVLGLGDIGALAGKPVMEGKGVLFKRFADIDVFDIEVNEKDPKKLIEIVAALEPTFGGINLEDIKAPECFEVEQTLKGRMNIPVFHDDQHGTAIISAAGMMNALEIQGKKIGEVKVVVSGAGASAIACMNLWIRFGIKRENIFMCDSKGVIHEGRRGTLDKTKDAFIQDTKARTLADAIKGADVFVGLSKGNMLTAEMAKTMASKAVIFAMANPDPEIPYTVAKQALPDAIIATGRSDFPNQVNNVLGFPFIFRGALDSGAKQITEEMKMAASRALAALAREDVPDNVRAAYGDAKLSFGRDYIIPKPLDERVLLWEAPAVAKAAMDCGVARKKLDMDEYRVALERRLGPSRMFVRNIVQTVKASPRTLVFPEADDQRVIRACRVLVDDGIARPVLLGNPVSIEASAKEAGIELKGIEVVDIAKRSTIEEDIKEILQARGRHGMTLSLARQLITTDPTVVALMMVRKGLVDGAVAGIHHGYPETIRMALKLVGVSEGVKTVAGVHAMVTKKGPMFFADTTVNIEPEPTHLADIAIMTARFARELGIEPHVAMLCYSNFGSSTHAEAHKIREAVKLVRKREPELDCDGEIQAQVALDETLRTKMWPQCRLKAQPNVLVFPNLGAANTSYQLVSRLGGAEEIGPVLLGLYRPVTVISPRASVNTIVQMAAMTALHGIKGSAWGHSSVG